MEKEINKIKIEYQSITPPKVLITNGVDDLWHRVDSKKQFFNMYFAHITTGILIFVILLGSIGIMSAQAKKGSALYPVKTFAQKALATFSKTPIVKFYNSQINQKQALKKNNQPTPLNSPTPTIKTEPTSENKNDDFKNEENNSGSNQNQNSHRENVKGASTTKNSHGENDNSKNSESQNHSDEGNSNNAQNQNRENNNDQNNENHEQGKN